MAGLQSGEGRMMIDFVVWAQYINVTDTETATSPEQMLCQCTVSGGKNKQTPDLVCYRDSSDAIVVRDGGPHVFTKNLHIFHKRWRVIEYLNDAV